ncbi:MAG: hypothetical protein WBX38_10690 [Candidatus Sulfotelmatobacter sp.]
MNLAGRNVRFRLSQEGLESLSEVASVTQYLDGLVVDENHLGVWVSLPQLQTANTVVLLKWEYFLTATLEYEPEAPATPSTAGFRLQ